MLLVIDSVRAPGDTQTWTKVRSIARLIMLKRMLNKARTLLDKIRKWNASEDNRFGGVGYTSVPSWRPWRDF